MFDPRCPDRDRLAGKGLRISAPGQFSKAMHPRANTLCLRSGIPKRSAGKLTWIGKVGWPWQDGDGLDRRPPVSGPNSQLPTPNFHSSNSEKCEARISLGCRASPSHCAGDKPGISGKLRVTAPNLTGWASSSRRSVAGAPAHQVSRAAWDHSRGRRPAIRDNGPSVLDAALMGVDGDLSRLKLCYAHAPPPSGMRDWALAREGAFNQQHIRRLAVVGEERVYGWADALPTGLLLRSRTWLREKIQDFPSLSMSRMPWYCSELAKPRAQVREVREAVLGKGDEERQCG
ncbi:hypothetical protein BKA56DRAFT_613301 [Ilyonectria sp. MPI-CAGE-AT-0026]|nr:hypothetical protein BKA56DRAFT_613301 [Ilyonectria sp. MPI-CAGE-AT-0026]